MTRRVKERWQSRNSGNKYLRPGLLLNFAAPSFRNSRSSLSPWNCWHKQVMLETYDQQCDEAAKIFAEYHKRLYYYVNQAMESQRSGVDSFVEMTNSFSAKSEKEAVYSTIKGSKSADDVILIETTREKNIRKACESLVAHMVEKIRSSFPAYEGSGIHLNPQAETAKLGFDYDGQISDEVRTVIINCLKSPP